MTLFTATVTDERLLQLPQEVQAQLKPGQRLRVTIQPEKRHADTPYQVKRPSALGKYAFVPGGSEAFASEKQAEIEREDRVRG